MHIDPDSFGICSKLRVDEITERVWVGDKRSGSHRRAEGFSKEFCNDRLWFVISNLIKYRLS